MGFRLLAFNLDGTILHSDRTISARTERAIHKAAKAGLILVPATGRSLTSLLKELLGYPEIQYMILRNGSSVYNYVNKCKAYEDCLLKSAAGCRLF